MKAESIDFKNGWTYATELLKQAPTLGTRETLYAQATGPFASDFDEGILAVLRAAERKECEP